MANVALLHPTGYHESVASRLLARPPAGADVFPGAEGFPKVALTRPASTLVYRLRREAMPAQVEVVARTPNRIVEILQLGYEAFKRSRPLPPHVREAAQMILRCRTSALGGHVEECPDGHIARIHYNSCGHRFCPRCGYRKRQHWIAQQREKLLPVRHFHVTFTIPREFNDLWWRNVKQMATDLFHAAAQALQELLADPERVGVQVGIVASLHTWDDRLRRHPHLHCLVTGGGLTPDEAWKDSWQSREQPFLVHVFPLMQRFRKLFCRTLERKIKKERLNLPEGCSPQQMLNTINKVNRSAWQVYIAKPPEDGGPTTEEILEYQAKAVAGGPLSDVRIEGIERTVRDWQEGIQAFQEPQLRYVSEAPLSGRRVQEVSHQEVSFRWGTYDKETGRRVRDQTETLPIEEFLRRLFWHVPPPDLHTIRQYGLYTSAKKAQYEKCRAILPKTVTADIERVTTAFAAKKDDGDGHIPLEEYMEQRTHCPVCGKPLEITRVIPSSVTGKISPRDKAFARKLSGTQRRRRGG
jgi:predicted nucleic acid-binding Zn ribbon protein